jgi:cell division protease FtsH
MPEGDPSRDPNRDQRPGPPGMRKYPGTLGWVVLVALIVMMATMFMSSKNRARQVPFSKFLAHLQNKEIEKTTVKDDSVIFRLKELQGRPQGEGRDFEARIPPEYAAKLMEELKTVQQADPKFTYEYTPSSPVVQVLITLLPWLLIFAFVWWFVIRQLRGASGGAGVLGNFGRSRHRVSSKDHSNVTFADVAGIEEAKEEVAEIIEFLKNPKKFQRLGGRIPRGVLLIGDPGCGKTLLAKAIAGEADVPFFSISGSDFVEMFVGVGASRVRDLFKQAKDNAPCIIFLDEIDAVGRRRGAGYTSGGHDEREQTLNAILVEMDGFDTSDQIIVIAATNRADVLDPALIRPGRFDRQVYVPLPDIKGRLEILKVHAKKIKLGPDADLHRLARGTPMFSGADLAAIINEAALIATMASKDYVEQEDLEEARDKVRFGRAKKSRVVDEREKIATAYHESGHALVQVLLREDADPLHKVSIIPRGPYAGATFSLPDKDRHNVSRLYLMAKLRIACAGRVAEELFLKDVNSGAYADIREATRLARWMVTELGMNERVGFVHLGETDKTSPYYFDLPGTREYSEETARTIDEEVKKLMDAAYADAQRLVRDNRPKIEALAQALLKYETLDGEEVNAIIRGETINRPSVLDLLDVHAGSPAAPQGKKPEPRPPGLAEDIGGGALPQPG